MTKRRRPLNRRGSEIFEFRHDNIAYIASISRFDDGGLAEIFIDGRKVGSAASQHAQDAAVLASLLLQHNIPVDAIRHSIVGPIAVALRIAEGGA